jgi:hypothetical protein
LPNAHKAHKVKLIVFERSGALPRPFNLPIMYIMLN